ncbi:MAG TPA: hypothetical protein VLH08_01530 [Acidobacteriota bacterium]|nr:hypothetical protein [Acidobacteriota bacterium]
MNKKMLISILVIFVMAMGLDFLFHAVLLAPDYARLANLYRIQSDQENHFPFMILAHVILAIGFVWIYNKGKEEKPWVAQGIRFGLAVAVLSAIPHYLIYYAVQPLPGLLVFKQILFGTITFVLMGIVTAGLNR